MYIGLSILFTVDARRFRRIRLLGSSQDAILLLCAHAQGVHARAANNRATPTPAVSLDLARSTIDLETTACARTLARDSQTNPIG